MPRQYQRRLGARNYKNYTQETLDTAIKKIQDHDMSIREAESSYGIHRNTLWLKMKDKNKKKPGGQTALTEEEEKTIAAHAIAVTTFGFPITILDLRCIVKAFLDKKGKNVRCFNGNFPGIEWAKLFMKRHNNLTERCEDETVAPAFIEDLQEKRQEVTTKKIRRRTKVNIPPGKSVGANDVAVEKGRPVEKKKKIQTMNKEAM